MTAETHPIEKEQVMAYLDGELSSGDAKIVASHLEHCAECRALAADFRALSLQMLDWKVEPAPAALEKGIRVSMKNFEAPSQEKKNTSPARFPWRLRRLVFNRWLWAGALAAACLAIGIALSVQRMRPSAEVAQFARLEATEHATTPLSQNPSVEIPDAKQSEQPASPLIARTAALTISVQNFQAARSSVDQIVRARDGYVGELKITSPKDGPQSLETTLRIPAAEFDAALASLRALGRVDEEQQGGEEVTAQVVDLDARLKNARETEERLAEVLRTRTGKIGDVLEVEKEMARVREEIEQMEGEQKELNTRVAFASVNLNLTEEYQPQLNGGRSMVLLQMRNALVDGYRSAADSFVSVLVFLLSVGPSLLIWGLLLFWPARWAWRRWKEQHPRIAKEA